MMAHMDSAAYRLAIRDAEWKYIYDFENPHDSKLFHVSEDPDERVNMRDGCTGVFRRFEQMRLAHVTLGLTSRMQRMRAGPTGMAPQHGLARHGRFSPDGMESAGDEILREQLEALGYL